MVSKAQKIRLGIFLAISSFMLLAFIGVVAGNRLLEKRDIYYIVYNDVSVNGLQVGGQVKYHGIQVGRIDDIKISKDDVSKIIVTISVSAGTPVMSDVEATLVPVGITGLKQVELTGGTAKGTLLKPKSFIRPGLSFFDNITGKAEVVAAKVELMMTNLNLLLGGENQKRFSSILSNVDSLIAENRKPISKTVAHVDSITYNLQKTTESAQVAMEQFKKIITSPEITRTIKNTAKFSDNLAQVDLATTIDNANQTITKLNQAVDQANVTLGRLDLTVQKNRPEINAIIENLRAITENLNEFSRMLSEDPSILLKSKKRN